MAIAGQRFARIAKQKRPEELRVILGDHSDYRLADSPRSLRRFRGDNSRAHWQFAASHRVEWASPRHVPRGQGPAQMQKRPPPPAEEMSAQLCRQTTRGRAHGEISFSPGKLLDRSRGFQIVPERLDVAANAASVAKIRRPVFPSYARAASLASDKRASRRRVVPL